MRKYACCYAQGRAGAREFRTQVSHATTPAEFHSIVRALFSTRLMSRRRVSGSFLAEADLQLRFYGNSRPLACRSAEFSNIQLSKMRKPLKLKMLRGLEAGRQWTTRPKAPTSASSTCCARRAAGRSRTGRATGVTATAVRQRLTRLMAQGLVDRRVGPGGRGRPSHRYGLTEKGRRQTGANFADLAMALWNEMRAIQDPEVRRGLLQRIAKTMAAMYGDQISGTTTAERMASFSRLFAERKCRSRSKSRRPAGADGPGLSLSGVGRARPGHLRDGANDVFRAGRHGTAI